MNKFILILFILSSAFNIYAQDDIKTDEIKVISSYGTDILSSPSHITVLDKNSLHNRNGSNISEILKTVTGVFVKSYGGPTALQTISMNGLGAEHTVILLNGSKLNSMQNGLYDLALIPSLSIKKVEVLNNGYSTLFGSEAIGGVVNIITDNSLEKKLKIDLNSAYGSFNSKDISFDISSNIKKFSFDFSASTHNSDNDYSYYYDNGTENELKYRAGAGYNISNYSVSSQYIFSPFVKTSYYTQFVNSRRDLPGLETGYSAPTASQSDKDWKNILQVNYSKKNISVISDINFQNNLLNYHTENVINSYYKNILLSGASRIELNAKDNLYVLGSEVKYGTLYSNETISDINRKHYSVFNSNTLKWKNLSFFPSLRYDYLTDLEKGAVTYRIGLNYKPLEKTDLHFRANAGRNFRAPTFNDLYWKDGGNPELKPEYSQNYEAGIVFHGRSVFEYTLDFSYLNIDLQDRIVWIPHRGSVWSPVNIGRSRSNILISSLQLQYSFSKEIFVKSGLSYTDNSSVKTSENYAQDPTTGKQIIYIPVNQVQASVEFKAAAGGINLFYSYLGKRFSNQENLDQLSPVNLLDGNIFYKFNIVKLPAEIKFELNNITNSDYQIISGYPTPLRNFKLKLNLGYSL